MPTHEVTIRFRANLEPDDDSGEEFADALMYALSDLIDDVEVLEVEEV